MSLITQAVEDRIIALEESIAPLEERLALIEEALAPKKEEKEDGDNTKVSPETT